MYLNVVDKTDNEINQMNLNNWPVIDNIAVKWKVLNALKKYLCEIRIWKQSERIIIICEVLHGYSILVKNLASVNQYFTRFVCEVCRVKINVRKMARM